MLLNVALVGLGRWGPNHARNVSASTSANLGAAADTSQEPLDIIRAGASRIVEVTDHEVAAAMRILFADTHNIAEGAGAAAFAAHKQEALENRKIGVILSGGNVDSEVFRAVLGGRTPTP